MYIITEFFFYCMETFHACKGHLFIGYLELTVIL